MSDSAKTQKLDPRLNVYRPDLAAESLRGRVEAAEYAEGQKRQVHRPIVPMRQRPEPGAPIINEMMFGEIVWVYEDKNGWSWCQLDRDDYVGYANSAALSTHVVPPTHRVSTWGTFVYRKADIKSEPLMHLSLGAQLAILQSDGRMSELANGGHIVNRHISEHTRHARDFVDLAERAIGTPYLWGGRSRIGIDCSGLVQVAMEAAGHSCPRDSDMQREMIGMDVPIAEDLSGIQRGDLVFWPGHVGIMADGVMLVHANAHHMAVTVEPLVTAAHRVERAGNRIAKIKRPAASAV